MITIETLSSIADAVRTAIRKIPNSAERGAVVDMGADGTSTSQIDKIAENAVLMKIAGENIPLNVLSEEIGYVDNDGEETLVMDPIDGTSNAIADIPYYTVSLAVGSGSLSGMRIAYLLNPATGDAYWAEKGKGAFKNGRRISVRDPDMGDLFMMVYLGNAAHEDAHLLAKRVGSSRSFGCASLEMALVAEGEADGQFMKSVRYSRSIRIVDIAASALILREAGGEVYGLDGKPLDMPLDLEHRANFLAVGRRKVFDFVISQSYGSEHRYGIYTNVNVKDAAECTRRVMDALGDKPYYVDKAIADVMGIEGMLLKDMDIDIAIVIGGDGTMLRAMQNTDAAVVGVNAGSVGFLSEIERDEIEDGIRMLLEGQYVVESRFKICTEYKGERLNDSINEALVHTSSVAKIRHYRVYVDDELACELRADGVIVSTPTGSTCYAMSLGAPYMHPSVDAMMIVPMAAYKFSSRPFIVPASSKIRIENVLDKECLIVLDGQKEVSMAGRTSVEFSMSNVKARFIRLDSHFFSRVREKLVNDL